MTKILLWDTENTPLLSYHWGRWSQDIRPNQTLEEARIMCFGAKWYGEKEYTYKNIWDHGRSDMLATINEMLSEADAVVSWNGVRHDTKKVKTEFLLEGIEPSASWIEVDLMRAVKRQFAFSSNSLNHVSQQLGVGTKVKHEGFFEIIPKVMAGDERARKKFAAYQKQDVVLLEKLYKRLLPWIPASMHPNVALGALTGCTKCGSAKLEKRGFKATTTGTYQQYKCLACGSWSRGSQRLETTALRPS